MQGVWRGPMKELTVENGYGCIVYSHICGGHAFGVEFRPRYGAGLVRGDEREATWTRLGLTSVATRASSKSVLNVNDHVRRRRQSGLLDISAPTYNQGDPSRRDFWREVRPRRNILGRRTENPVFRMTMTMDKPEVRRTSRTGAWIRLTRFVL